MGYGLRAQFSEHKLLSTFNHPLHLPLPVPGRGVALSLSSPNTGITPPAPQGCYFQGYSGTTSLCPLSRCLPHELYVIGDVLNTQNPVGFLQRHPSSEGCGEQGRPCPLPDPLPKPGATAKTISASAAAFSRSETSPLPVTRREGTKSEARGDAFRGWHVPAAAGASRSPVPGAGTGGGLGLEGLPSCRGQRSAPNLPAPAC